VEVTTGALNAAAGSQAIRSAPKSYPRCVSKARSSP
jgi:hypothetical protein